MKQTHIPHSPVPYYVPVKYSDHDHRYFLESDPSITYISATTLVHHFSHKFDTEERSSYMAERYSQTPEYWQKRWQNINRVSIERGNRIHLDLEQVARAGEDISFEKMVHLLQCVGTTYTRSPISNQKIRYSLYPSGTYPEIMLWNHDWRIAGRCDLGIISHTNDMRGPVEGHYRKPIFSLLDYKTNKRISLQSYQDPRNRTFRMMKWPLNYIMDSNYWHYVLQLSLYQFMAEYHRLGLGTRTIIHFPHEIEGLGTPDPVPYQIPYMKKAVIRMLLAYHGIVKPPVYAQLN